MAFAARCSLRVLPLLMDNTKKDAFWYWDEKNRSEYVMTLLIAQQISINFSAFGRKNYFIDNATAAFFAAATDATRTQSNIDLETVILLDLDMITTEQFSFFQTKKSKTILPADFIYSPLWSSSMPENWQLLYVRFKEALIDLVAGFDLWVKWYEDRINGGI